MLLVLGSCLLEVFSAGREFGGEELPPQANGTLTVFGIIGPLASHIVALASYGQSGGCRTSLHLQFVKVYRLSIFCIFQDSDSRARIIRLFVTSVLCTRSGRQNGEL